MTWRFVEIERREHIAVVSFDSGERLNALSRDLMVELTRAARAFEGDHETRAVVLTGRPESFTAGLDLKDAGTRAQAEPPLAERRQAPRTGPRMCQAWWEVEPLTICAIEGFCVGGGVSLAVACDLRVMAHGAHYRVPELELGMNMSWRTLPRLAHLVGPAKAKEIVVLAEAVDAETALRWGLADRVAAEGAALEVAIDLAFKVATKPPVPVRMTKRTVNAAVGGFDWAVSHMDFDQYALCQASGDFAEGVRAYLEKRQPRFTGR